MQFPDGAQHKVASATSALVY